MEVISTHRYEARPPSNKTIHSDMIRSEHPVALVKEEEWETRKKKEITTTRQIETRVKRQVILEDGEVIKDSGPLVTTNTTEDVEQQEHTTKERRTNGDEPAKEIEWNGSNGRLVQKEMNETVVRSREEVEELLETEARRHFGDITDEAYQQAVKNNSRDLRQILGDSGKHLPVEIGPRVVQHTTKSNKVIDTEKKHERKELKADGGIVTETKTSITHEEIRDDPDLTNGVDDQHGETRKESSQKFVKKRDEDIVDYVLDGERIAREMRYVSETTEGDRIGDWPPSTMRTVRLQKPIGTTNDNDTMNRKDALTKKPLDPDEEDEARKFETSKWLESHFGSESRSSHGSIEHDILPSVQTAANTSYINVTMKSCTPRDRKYKSESTSNVVHRQPTPPQPQTQRSQHRQHEQYEQVHVHHQRPRSKTSRGIISPNGGYFQGISEWSERERYQGPDKVNNNGDTSAPGEYIIETQRSNGHQQSSPHKQVEIQKNLKDSSYIRNYENTSRSRSEFQQRTSPPSPPIRRRARQQVTSFSEEKNSGTDGRSGSPIQVVQRTWENRSREIPQIRRHSPSRYRSNSPIIKISVTPSTRREKKSNEKSNKRSHSPRTRAPNSKSKISESFRKLVDKLRSASTERRNKKSPGISSTSQLTQTDDSSTYLQYNVIDKNIPEIRRDEVNGKASTPERPPRSPRNSNASPVTKTIKVTRMNGHIANYDQYGRNDSVTPVHRYYIEESFSGRHDRGKKHGKSGRSERISPNHDYSLESTSLGRFSKSVSRLTNDHEREDHFTSAQTLPRKLHIMNHQPKGVLQSSNRNRLGPSGSSNHSKQFLAPSSTLSSKSNPSRHYGSMINISIKNAVSPPTPEIPPAKPERTYKASLARSKSFNVLEASKNGSDTPYRIPYKSNTQLNRLDETPPLKSPGILASISRSNRDLFKEEY